MSPVTGEQPTGINQGGFAVWKKHAISSRFSPEVVYADSVVQRLVTHDAFRNGKELPRKLQVTGKTAALTANTPAQRCQKVSNDKAQCTLEGILRILKRS